MNDIDSTNPFLYNMNFPNKYKKNIKCGTKLRLQKIWSFHIGLKL